jgi:hypothetical protein
MFCLADIKNEDNFGKTVGPAPAKDLWITNPGKPMNSNFDKLDGLKSMKMKLEESHTTIITNCNLLTAGKFPPKVMQRKNARENARACDVTKIFTSGRIKYEPLENGTEKISQVDLCADPI